MSAYKKLMLNNKSLAETTDEVEQSAIDSQVDKFKTDYSADKFNELCNEFESITLDKDTDTVTQANVRDVEKVSARAKLFLVSTLLVFSLVLFLFIYNFVVINRMQNSINLLQDDAIYQEYQAGQKAKKLDELTDDEKIKAKLDAMGYAEGASENATQITVGGGASESVKTNWFDRLCGFIGSIFGG